MSSESKTWLVADIHGGYGILWKALCERGFNPSTDQLWSVGDLVNRGADSEAALAWLEKPWFHAIQGNHEAMILQAWEHPNDEQNCDRLKRVGGEWWFSWPKTKQQRFAWLIERLPLSRTLDVAGKSIGLVHADVPDSMSWPEFSQALIDKAPHALETALWSRRRWSDWQAGLSGKQIPDVAGVDYVFIGHSPVDKPSVVGNVVYFDTGLWRGETQSVICLDEFLPTLK